MSPHPTSKTSPFIFNFFNSFITISALDSSQGCLNVKSFFSDKGDFVVIPLDDAYGTTVYDSEFEAIVVSEETEPTAVEINEIRVSKGMKPIDIVVVSFVLAYDGNPISSTRIRSGEINNRGYLIR